LTGPIETLNKEKTMKNLKLTVSIGEKTTRLLIDPAKEINSFGGTAKDYDGGDHNYDGIRGYAIERAVEKLFGKSCCWFGNCDMLYHGQVLDGNSTRTPNVVADVIEGW
jgi:hypothetical protein